MVELKTTNSLPFKTTLNVKCYVCSLLLILLYIALHNKKPFVANVRHNDIAETCLKKSAKNTLYTEIQSLCFTFLINMCTIRANTKR